MLFNLKTFIADANILGEIRTIGWSEDDHRLSISGISYEDATKIVRLLAEPLRGWSANEMADLRDNPPPPAPDPDEPLPEELSPANDEPLEPFVAKPRPTPEEVIAAVVGPAAAVLAAATDTIAAEAPPPTYLVKPAVQTVAELVEQHKEVAAATAPVDSDLGDTKAFAGMVYLQDVVRELQRRGAADFVAVTAAVHKLKDAAAVPLLNRITNIDVRLQAACSRLSVPGTP